MTERELYFTVYNKSLLSSEKEPPGYIAPNIQYWGVLILDFICKEILSHIINSLKKIAQDEMFMLFGCKVPNAVYSIQPYQPFHFSAKRPFLTAMLKIQNIAWIYRSIWHIFSRRHIHSWLCWWITIFFYICLNVFD